MKSFIKEFRILTIKFNNSRTSKIVFILSILVSVYWLLGQFINVYRYVLIGAIFEILWLPALIGLFVLPFISLIFIVEEKFSLKSCYPYSFLIVVLVFLFIVLNSANA
jgi:hypothetical protein